MLKVNKQVLIDFIISCLEKGDKRSTILAKVGEEWQEKVSERTFDRALKTANEQQKERLEKARKAADAAYIENNVNAVKTVLKSKIEKQAELQNEINLIDKQINGEVEFTFVVGNKVNKSHSGDVFMLPVQIQNELRARKLQYYAELNKMNGDYAPTKVANTDKDGNDVKQVIIIGGKEVQF
jgi:vacuolar-type H+-ATPase subunit I/STV1